MGPAPEPANRGGKHTFSPTLGQGFGLEPIYRLGQARPIPSEDMMSIPSLHLPRRRYGVPGFKLPQPPRQVSGSLAALVSSRDYVASVTADVSLDGLVLNGRLFNSPVQPSEYAAVLGVPCRVVEPSPPAPYGHRNNQIHLFDEFGLYLIKHHATRLIDAVDFVLWLQESPFKPAREFSGQLTVGGVGVCPGMLVKEFSGSTIAFNGPVLGLWSAEKNGVWVGLRAAGIRQRSGRRGKRLRFENVSVCFSSPK
jgi:hypothetical protein